MSSVIQLRARWSITPFCLRPSVCSFLPVLARNLECSVLGLDAYLVGCLDLCKIPSSVTFFHEGDSRWDSVVWTIMCHLKCQRVFETIVEGCRSDTRTCRRPMLFWTAARDQAEYAKCLKWQILAIYSPYHPVSDERGSGEPLIMLMPFLLISIATFPFHLQQWWNECEKLL